MCGQQSPKSFIEQALLMHERGSINGASELPSGDFKDLGGAANDIDGDAGGVQGVQDSQVGEAPAAAAAEHEAHCLARHPAGQPRHVLRGRGSPSLNGGFSQNLSRSSWPPPCVWTEDVPRVSSTCGVTSLGDAASRTRAGSVAHQLFSGCNRGQCLGGH